MHAISSKFFLGMDEIEGIQKGQCIVNSRTNCRIGYPEHNKLFLP